MSDDPMMNLSQCENCGATDDLTPDPLAGNLRVCGLCSRRIEANIRAASPETVRAWLDGEAAIARGEIMRGVGPAPQSPTNG